MGMELENLRSWVWEKKGRNCMRGGRGCVVALKWRVPWNQEFGDVRLGPIYSAFAAPFCPTSRPGSTLTQGDNHLGVR